ncbi:unnamed protein product [Leptidea sinapis]|uniref:DBB domain-containing protein n=1 Tax=Leptidea sinapis TaxID=189913 RepID=A0A5E4QBG8_9NEOP|nr:unnamed protein product [Leptidea sinapis]
MDVTDNPTQGSAAEQFSRSAPARSWADGSRPLSSPRRKEPESPRRKEFRALLRTLKGKISTTLVTSEGTKEHEEVFYTIPLQGRRRHSVGGYLATEGSGVGEVTAVPSEMPKMPPPRINSHEDEVRRRRPRNFSFKEMEDIAIVWSSGSPESLMWSKYLVASFDKIMSQRARHHYRVTPITAEELMSADSQDKLDKLAKAQLQIVIMCPILIHKMSELKQELACDNFFKAEKILDDTSFVDTFLTSAVGILRTKDCKDTATDKTSFSIVPKKVKIGQSRVIALLNDPIREEDSIKIMVDKKGEVIQIPAFKKRNPYTCRCWCGSALVRTVSLWAGDKSNVRNSWTAGCLVHSRRTFHLTSTCCLQPNSGEEYPTLLHWAARFGLERVCWQLLECPEN